MTAPERLWAWYDYDEDGWDNAYATTHDQIPHSAAYIRYDLHAALQAENERLREALTPSGDTKAAYMGEFFFTEYYIDEDGDEMPRKVYVPWTTIKDIMQAVSSRAAMK